jgi:hypothetical protein
MNLSWGTEHQKLSVNALAAVVEGLDGLNPVFLLRDPAALVGNIHDIEELLADVGGNDEIAALRLQWHLAEDGVGPLLSPGGGLAIPRHMRDIDKRKLVVIINQSYFDKLTDLPIDKID